MDKPKESVKGGTPELARQLFAVPGLKKLYDDVVAKPPLEATVEELYLVLKPSTQEQWLAFVGHLPEEVQVRMVVDMFVFERGGIRYRFEKRAKA
jgi:hypothetical protein